jgi:predicted phosphodiesterase
MRLRILSDLHLQHHPPPPGLDDAGEDADAVVLAGDIHHGPTAVTWARQAFRETPVVTVAGNHEYYDALLKPTQRQLQVAAADTPNVRFLERESCIIGDVRFLGCTFWTGFHLFPEQRNAAMRASRASVGDFRRIHLLREGRPFRPRDADAEHRRALAWLRREFAQSPPGVRATVVVTHHAPSPRSMDPRYSETLTSAAFVTDCESVVRKSGAAVWIHGHVHRSFDYHVGPTRLVCNPRGYPGENETFDPGLIIDV